jgi:hypothetical protein
MQAATAIFEQIRPLVSKLDEAERFALIRSIALLEAESTSAEPITADVVGDEGEDAQDAQLLGEQVAWFTRPKVERLRYQGQYVAVYQREVVDHDPERRALYLRVRKRFGPTPVLLVPADWDAVPEFTIHSTSRLQ